MEFDYTFNVPTAMFVIVVGIIGFWGKRFIDNDNSKGILKRILNIIRRLTKMILKSMFISFASLMGIVDILSDYEIYLETLDEQAYLIMLLKIASMGTMLFLLIYVEIYVAKGEATDDAVLESLERFGNIFSNIPSIPDNTDSPHHPEYPSD